MRAVRTIGLVALWIAFALACLIVGIMSSTLID
jgi:hypothetical protein